MNTARKPITCGLYVNYLRQKLEKDPANPKYILTERGVGYRFVDFQRPERSKAEPGISSTHPPGKE